MTVSADIQELIDKYFPPTNHPYRILERAILDHLTPSATVLEIGCGRAALVLRAFKGKGAKLIGIDVVDFDVADEGILLLRNDVTDMTDVATASIDVAFSRSVMEHVRGIETAFSEIRRVLKPNGSYIFLTPNFYDYASLIAATIPNPLHPWIVKRTEGRAMALFQMVLDNQDKYHNMTDIMTEIKLQVGHYKEHVTTGGKIVFVPQSIAFDKMKELEFKEFMEKSINVILKFMCKGMDRSILEQIVRF